MLRRRSVVIVWNLESTCVPVWLPMVITDSFTLSVGMDAYLTIEGCGLSGYTIIPSAIGNEIS